MSLEAGTSPIMNDITPKEALSPLFATAISFLIINTIFLVLRFYTVLFLRRKRLGLTWDDWCLVPSWACTSGIAICGLVMWHYEGNGDTPYGAHTPIMIPERLFPVLKAIYGLILILIPAYAFTRYSILALYLRVFSAKWLRLLSWFFIGFITVQWIAYTFAAIFQCTPVNYYWNREIEGHCFDVDRFNKSITPANIAADSIILVMPLPTIWRMQASKLRKAGYTLVLGLGVFAFVSSVVRLVIFDNNTTIVITASVTNIELQWLIIEPSLYFITACLPTMHPLFRLLVPSSIRRTVENKVAESRHNRSTHIHGSTASQPFARLADDEPGLARERHRADGKAARVLGSGTGGLAQSEVEARAEGRRNSRLGVEDVPMDDLRQLAQGDRIIVQTEITVSQEERMENVLGF